MTLVVGKPVWIVRPDSHDGTQAEAGFITFVHSDTLINVVGFNKAGVPFTRTDLPFTQDTELPGDYACWPEARPAKPIELAVAAAIEEDRKQPAAPPPPLEGNAPLIIDQSHDEVPS